MKRHKPAAHENHERWMVSYADFITLLFAFFVVMFSTAQADKKKAKAVSDSVRQALEHGQMSATISAVLGRGKPQPGKAPAAEPSEDPPPAATPPAERPADLVQSLAVLERQLEQELKSGKVKVKLEGRGLVISLREAAFFASGDDAIAPASLASIDKIAAVIRTAPNPLRLEGYTDSVPIHNSRFRSNWELSAARSIVMLELLRQRFDIPAERMSVAGYAENAPAEPNDTAEGRAHNRRVELVLLSAEALKNEPGATR
jgi:chemotaxis protein MotB